MTHPATTRGGEAATTRSLRARLADAWRRARDWDRRIAASRTLHALDDHILRDIGLHRADIDAEIRRRQG